MNKYQKGKARVIELAKEYQNSYIEGKQYSYGELAYWEDYFTRLGKRYGLLREFRAEGIC